MGEIPSSILFHTHHHCTWAMYSSVLMIILCYHRGKRKKIARIRTWSSYTTWTHICLIPILETCVQHTSFIYIRGFTESDERDLDPLESPQKWLSSAILAYILWLKFLNESFRTILYKCNEVLDDSPSLGWGIPMSMITGTEQENVSQKTFLV